MRLAIASDLIGSDMAKVCVAAFLVTEFAGGRHSQRLEKLSSLATNISDNIS